MQSGFTPQESQTLICIAWFHLTASEVTKCSYGHQWIAIAPIGSVKYFQTMNKTSYDVIQVYHNEKIIDIEPLNWNLKFIIIYCQKYAATLSHDATTTDK